MTRDTNPNDWIDNYALAELKRDVERLKHDTLICDEIKIEQFSQELEHLKRDFALIKSENK